MVKSSRERFKPFVETLGRRMTRLNFPEKFALKNYCFKQKTEAGYVGIFVIPNARGGGEYSVSLRAAISNTIVQHFLVKTELYDWDGGLTWSCGVDLDNLQMQMGAFKKLKLWPDKWYSASSRLARIDREAKQQQVWIDIDVGPKDYERLADQAYSIIEGWGWPALKQYGFSDATLLEFCLRNDEYSKLFFLEPDKPLTGMILARHFGKPDAVSILIDQARRDYGVFASLGNQEPIERFERVAKALGFEV